jgi:uncharacterized protein YhfF
MAFELETTSMPDDLTDDPRVRKFWNAFARATCVSGQTFSVFGFGDRAELADELVGLVMAGTKRARTTLPRDFLSKGRPLPKPGDFGVIVDGEKTPRCMIRTVRVDVMKMKDVDANFAWDSGGGDRSLAWWRAAHERYFKRQGAREGFAVDGDTEVVLERFEVVWPPESADGKAPGA